VIEIDDPGAAPYVSDLELILSDDSTGDSVILYTGAQPVTPETRMVATFDDAAGSLAPTSNHVLGTFLPVQALSIFDDNELSGDWTLSIQDLSTWTDEDIDLISWHLVAAYSAPEPNTGMLVSIGLIGLGWMGRRPRRRSA
jgi:hypothetical protein